MALQTGVFKFTGRLQNVIGYRRNGKYFFRSMPDKVRQTAATRRAARKTSDLKPPPFHLQPPSRSTRHEPVINSTLRPQCLEFQ